MAGWHRSHLPIMAECGSSNLLPDGLPAIREESLEGPWLAILGLKDLMSSWAVWRCHGVQ
jgi:hypothetical protein